MRSEAVVMKRFKTETPKPSKSSYDHKINDEPPLKFDLVLYFVIFGFGVEKRFMIKCVVVV